MISEKNERRINTFREKQIIFFRRTSGSITTRFAGD